LSNTGDRRMTTQDIPNRRCHRSLPVLGALVAQR
jgi:hypothetical protein